MNGLQNLVSNYHTGFLFPYMSYNLKIKINREELIEWLLVISIPLFRVETLLMIYLLFKQKFKGANKYFGVALILFVHASLLCLICNYNIGKSVQQIILIGIHFVAYYGYFKYRPERFKKVWGKYLSFCEILGLLGFIQAVFAILFHTDIFSVFTRMEDAGIGDELRLHAIFGEAGYLATYMVPYVIYSLQNIRQVNKKKFVVSLLVFICTFSSAAYAVMILYVIYKLMISRFKIVTWAIIPLFIMYIGLTLEDFSKNSENKSLASSTTKINQTIDALSDLDPYTFENFNLSTYAILTNLWVASNAPSRLVGTGIGTHQQSYVSLYKSNFNNYGLNKEDAYSIGTRIFSEFGILGLSILLFFVFHYRNKKNDINIACFFYIVAILLRGGFYTYNGVMLFLFLYYFTSHRIRLAIKTSSEGKFMVIAGYEKKQKMSSSN